MRFVKLAFLVIIVIFAGIQVLPQGRPQANPAVTEEPEWDSPRTEELARRACFDCHSNETSWPWYAYVAPASWRVTGHVQHARSELNFSEFDKPQREAHEAAEQVEQGEMPPWDYLLLHPEARLSEQEKQELIDGLRATFGDERHDESEGR